MTGTSDPGSPHPESPHPESPHPEPPGVERPLFERPLFERLGEDHVYAGYAMDVVVGRFRSPDGETFTRDVIRHRGAVGVLPLHDDGTVTLVRQYRAPIDAYMVEIPAGLRDVEGEDPAVTAHRELGEEVGLAADRLELLTVFHNAAGLSDEQVHVYLATGLRPVESDVQGPEERSMTVERMALDDLVAAVEAGTITDAKTVIGSLLTARR